MSEHLGIFWINLKHGWNFKHKQCILLVLGLNIKHRHLAPSCSNKNEYEYNVSLRETECAGSLFVLSTVGRKIGYAQNQTEFQRQNSKTFYFTKFPNVSDFFLLVYIQLLPATYCKKKTFLYCTFNESKYNVYKRRKKKKKVKSESNLIRKKNKSRLIG